MLGPDGAIDGFFKRELRQYVNVNVSPWRWRPGVGAALGMQQDRLAFFEQAAQLREALFPNGAREPRVNLTVYPVAFDDGVSVARMSVGGSNAPFPIGDETPRQLQWPGAQPANGATVSLGIAGFIDPVTGETKEEELSSGKPGTWGLFKLIDDIGFRPRGGGAQGRIRFAIGGRAATLELRMNSSTNPFALRKVIATFRCPASL